MRPQDSISHPPMNKPIYTISEYNRSNKFKESENGNSYAFNRCCTLLFETPCIGCVLKCLGFFVMVAIGCCETCYQNLCATCCNILCRKIKIAFTFDRSYSYEPDARPTFYGLNHDFYDGRLKIRFNNRYRDIDNVLIYLRENRSQLEKHDSYMHWLFPIDSQMGDILGSTNEYNLNYDSTRGIQAIDDAKSNFFQAFQIILDFWGMAFCMDGMEVSIQKTPEWTERLAYMSTQEDTCLHIARVIRSLSYFGMVEYQEPLLNFLMNEVLITQSMREIIKNKLVYYWIEAADYRIQDKLRETLHKVLQIHKFFEDQNQPRDRADNH